MTPEAQQIAIAEACGWVGIQSSTAHYPYGYRPSNPFPHDKPTESLPDYLSDLNEMREAEEVFSAEQTEHYSNQLLTLLESAISPDDQRHVAFQLAHATAAQRAEAFLKTIGKWQEYVIDSPATHMEQS